MLESILLTSSQKIVVSSNKSLRKNFLFNFIKSIAEKFIARKSIKKKSSAKKSSIFKAIKSTISYNIHENSLANIFDDNKNKKKLMK